ncbi:MAG TPA: protein-methionine-sulfoxide reductase heme-binding subunit MsrQ [Arenimonas sp.]|nr:protein-methionine-sulfoxide reductase heme-binding subunit MsrQ [Arenimonas sp.]
MLALSPAAVLFHAAWTQRLGADPVAALTHETGQWALRFLLLSLAMTPLRRLFALGWPLQLRRMLGLYAFFYASLHLAVYVVLDLGGYWAQIGEDIIDRPYITVGFLAWLLLVPLAATSTRAMMRRLGGLWARLHRLVYVIGVLAVLHFWWRVKADLSEPIIYGAVLALLLGLRLYLRWRPNQPRRGA